MARRAQLPHPRYGGKQKQEQAARKPPAGNKGNRSTERQKQPRAKGKGRGMQPPGIAQRHASPSKACNQEAKARQQGSKQTLKAMQELSRGNAESPTTQATAT